MRQLLLGLSLCVAFIATAAPSKQPTEIQQLQQQVQTLQATAPQQQEEIKQLKEQVQTLERDLAVFQPLISSRLDMQDKRVSDFGISTSWLGIGVAVLGILITLIAIATGFLTYISVRNRATQEAKDAAEDAAKKWFNDNDDLLIEELRQKTLQALKEVDEHVVATTQEVNKAAANAKKELDELVAHAAHQPLLLSDPAAQTQPSPEAIQAVRAASQALESKPEIEFTAQEHYVRGLSEYNAKRFDSALVNFEKAMDAAVQEEYTSEELANFLFAIALTNGALNKEEEEIQLYDELAQRFGNDTSPAVRELVVRALVNKGFKLGKFDRSEDAIQVYDDLLQKFGRDTSPAVREQVVKALINKGVRLGKLDRGEEAIQIYDDLLQQFGNDTSPTMRENMAQALLNKGYRLGQMNRSEDEIQVYEDLVQRFDSDPSPSLRKLVAKALLYKGITLAQLDRREEAIKIYELIVETYADASEPEIQELVARAQRLLNRLQGGDDDAAILA